ncbi:monosaccharide ABC transporter substrate-binding protein (CUT2 family) [Acidipila rosea]|uniref:Monosaccharide ABC transporter substrate-binding protein (CUT2 family) n=1 Tax=Acidipila rosea TaxID=768535 RepID=A0A4R1LAJ5_9BACT|nr:monosaccharide ABC transporter substrate-binding protein (CUT2 family) [Acidipila rosea]
MLSSCHRKSVINIAVIPRTSGTMLWEPEHAGAMSAAVAHGAKIYWNAPTREDDIQGQIAIVESVSSGDYQGLILAPDHALALITPVRRAIARGLQTVIVGSPLAIPPGGRLHYILNDEVAGGHIAAQRLGTILHGRGTIAVLGIDPDITGIMERARSLEHYLSEHYPNIRVVANQMGSFNVPHEQQVAEETLKAHPDLDAIVALTSTSTHGALSAIAIVASEHPRVIAFDPDALTFDNPSMDSYIVQDTRRMGAEAVDIILAGPRNETIPATMQFQPTLVTRENANSQAVRKMTSMDWRPAPMRWKWSVGP